MLLICYFVHVKSMNNEIFAVQFTKQVFRAIDLFIAFPHCYKAFFIDI